MRPEFAEHKVLAAADLVDADEYLDDAFTRHVDGVHGGDGTVLVAASVAHPDGRAAIGLGTGATTAALTVSAPDAGGQLSEKLRITDPSRQPAPSQLVFSRPAAAPAKGPAPGTMTLLAGVGNPAATELRIEAPSRTDPGRILSFRFRRPPARRPLVIDSAGTVIIRKLRVTGRIALGPAPAPATTATSGTAGSVVAAEALRQQLTQGLGIGADKGLGIAIASPTLGGGRVRFTVEVTDTAAVAPLSVTIKGRVNVGTTLAADDLGLLPAQLLAGQMLRCPVDLALPAGASGDVIVAVTAYGVHPVAGLVNASEARLLGTV